MTSVTLLKHGKPAQYQQCDCCPKYARSLSKRGWCAACEYECTEVGKKVRAILDEMKTAADIVKSLQVTEFKGS